MSPSPSRCHRLAPPFDSDLGWGMSGWGEVDWDRDDGYGFDATDAADAEHSAPAGYGFDSASYSTSPPGQPSRVNYKDYSGTVCDVPMCVAGTDAANAGGAGGAASNGSWRARTLSTVSRMSSLDPSYTSYMAPSEHRVVNRTYSVPMENSDATYVAFVAAAGGDAAAKGEYLDVADTAEGNAAVLPAGAADADGAPPLPTPCSASPCLRVS